MKKSLTKCFSVLLAALLVASSLCPVSRARAALAAPSLSQEKFSDQELDQLFGPIALYPDPLLAQVIPAATFVDQIQQADRLLKGKVNESQIQKQNWDVSVKAVAHYPQVLKMMDEQQDWTTAVGQAYVYQSTDVMKSIQRLRVEAKSSGALVTTPQQEVVVEQDVIKIVPAQPKVIYVPQYDPQVVYVESSSSSNSGVSTGTAIAATAIAFGAGLAIGAWMNRDWNWYGPGIYYHGWSGGGWIGVNRTFVNVHNNVYVNNRYSNVNINRNVVNRNISNYRADINNRISTNQRLDINRQNLSRDRINARNNGNSTLGNRVGNSTRTNSLNNRSLNNSTGKLNRNWKNSSANIKRSASQANRSASTLANRANTTNRASTGNRTNTINRDNSGNRSLGSSERSTQRSTPQINNSSKLKRSGDRVKSRGGVLRRRG